MSHARDVGALPVSPALSRAMADRVPRFAQRRWPGSGMVPPCCRHPTDLQPNPKDRARDPGIAPRHRALRPSSRPAPGQAQARSPSMGSSVPVWVGVHQFTSRRLRGTTQPRPSRSANSAMRTGCRCRPDGRWPGAGPGSGRWTSRWRPASCREAAGASRWCRPWRAGPARWRVDLEAFAVGHGQALGHLGRSALSGCGWRRSRRHGAGRRPGVMRLDGAARGPPPDPTRPEGHLRPAGAPGPRAPCGTW